MQGYIGDFASEHGIELRFSDTARAWLEEQASAQNRPPADLCAELLADYGHGLKLVGLEQVEISAETLDHPKEQLNTLIKAAYDAPA